MRPRRLALASALALSIAAADHLPAAQDREDEDPRLADVRADARAQQPGSPDLPRDAEIISQGGMTYDEAGNVVFEGPVSLTWGENRLQADRVVYRDERYVEAEGHVLLVWAGNRIAGTRAVYDLETDRGRIDDAIGKISPDYYFWAASAEKTGADTIHLESATVTTCTQPVPYWSFSVSSANIRVDHYAHMWNVRLRTGKLPVFYLPYLVWPVKQERAFGLLIPQIRSTQSRGTAFHQELFIPIGRSADLTLVGRHYTTAGFGGGADLRLIPNRNGEARMSGFYIKDKVAGAPRWRAEYQQAQRFQNGFRMLADINAVSDFNYYSDFERELRLVSSPTILARLEFSRNGRWTSLNVRQLRREQLFIGGDELVQSTLPEIEWRGRSRRLWKTPLYLSFESSLATIRQDGAQAGLAIDADYLRGDLFPTLTLPLSKLPWLEVSPRVSHRVTYYGQQQRLVTDTSGLTRRMVLDRSMTRQLFGAGLQIVGPKFYRIYNRKNGSRYKHSFEPNLSYGYLETFDRPGDILQFDEVDRFNGAGAQVIYGIRSRLFAKRPRAKSHPGFGSGEAIVLPPGMVPQPGADTRRLPEKGDGSFEPVEIATLELRQSRSFDSELSRADLDADGIDEETSPYSSLSLVGRYNPTERLSFDVRGSYHILYNRMSDVSISGLIRERNGLLDLSFVHREGLGFTNAGTTASPMFVERDDDTQVRVTAGVSLFGNRLQLMADGSIDANPAAGQQRIPNKTWRAVYSTQCCTFTVERLDRNFSSLEPRDDWFFRIDLKGLGKLVDFSN